MSSNYYSIQDIAKIIGAEAVLVYPDAIIRLLLTDSRTVIDAASSLFFALNGQGNGHHYISQAYQNGVRNFVISEKVEVSKYEEANFLRVENTLNALQNLARFNRDQHHLKVIGITGSNGKTVVKEWLYQLLNTDFDIVRSPKSYNSQIGVPLSVWQIEEHNTLGIFEAGISRPDEMASLAKIIKPTIGILTNIGEAHAEGFNSKSEKLKEKLKLFTEVELLIYSPEYTEGTRQEDLPGTRKYSWSTKGKADLQITDVDSINGATTIQASYESQTIQVELPFSDKASIENGIICLATLLALGFAAETAAKRLKKLSGVNMRLALINGIQNCSIIDDSYSADSSSLAIALDFLNLQNQHPKKTLILSDLHQTGRSKEELYKSIADLLEQKGIDRLICVGEDLSSVSSLFNLQASFYPTTQDFIDAFPSIHFANETILVKGARAFGFERITKLLTLKIHDTVLEINLNALATNLQYYRNKLKPDVKIMVMVKAFSYGSGSFEIANVLQHQKVDYLAVAYADEGIALRKSGIGLPIMVMSPEPSAFEAMIKYNLEPEIYSEAILKSFINFLPTDERNFKIHIKLDTGMHRLGFEREELPGLLSALESTKRLTIESIFTHLVASEQPEHDDFTKKQISEFKVFYELIAKHLNYSPTAHVLNTSGITRWPDDQMDMVRLGIGLYGFDSASGENNNLQTVAVLKTTVTQVKNLKPGETVGYGRLGMLPNGGKTATVKIGYADGYNRKFGNGVGKMMINGKLFPVIGAVCMDMCMLDVSGEEVKTGDEVIVFNHDYNIDILANQIQTSPYEILTNVSQRVKRIYFFE
ncbi:MAG: bifunctional UDP-N-acetylmuramoyl-tripeptide:D-alanyl-D-alanine ligase/alanine racemase [Pedobacter sp.]|nr:MAG: bifunctional UDP-N-acetylmuramoyl-tripeptide:D-alanyl-D-alanine ligase/alanine racemase [Pedobacter sp.]